jgi:ABC-type dipeptide/oligopeptide/nickel transport system permease subunit
LIDRLRSAPTQPANAGVLASGQGDGPVTPDLVEREFTVKARTQSQLIIRRFLHHRLAIASLIVLGIVVVLAFGGGQLWKYSYDEVLPLVDRGRPTLDLIPWIDGDGLVIGDHPFGQDNIGRDYFALTLRGAQQSLVIAITAGLLATALGTIVGAVAGFYRSAVDNVLMRIVDVMLTIPLLLVAAVLGRKVGSDSIFLLAIVIAAVSWLTIARVIRAEFLSLREKEYIEAARALGTKNARIIRKHMLPNVAGTIIVNATLLISTAILIETALSFLGVGVGAGDWSLGKQVSDYQNAFNTRPWLFWWPGLFIIVIALTINFIGDGLRDAFDPRQTRVRQ